MPPTVAIIGAGPLGRWLALSAARAGFRVLLEDVMPANLHHAQEALRAVLGPEGGVETEGGGGFNPRIESIKTSRALAPAECFSVSSNISFVSTIEEAVRNADLVIDCVPDELESKLEILWLLDRMAPPRAVLATPTTRLSITDLANCTYRPAKCIAIAAEANTLTGKSEVANLAAGSAYSKAGTTPEILLRTTTKTAPETVLLLDHFWRQLGFTPVFAPDPAEKPSN
ncbi:MAG TPA: 3-hydroxyacyl-CoA dehydrogenase NAD-binding domain-containing protein [Terracidiphilus sp.]|nr:3-hydroxyacyl-CoA dehydrogenase NAD-binding domain-containing protein [Terracidiphilus sp.]